MNEIVLCIDDEEDLLELMEINLNITLKHSGYEVIGCLNANMAKRFLKKEHVALILVDRNLLSEDGMDFIKELKKLGYDIPVIIVSALSLPTHRIEGLRHADDYVTKPFNFEELTARIQAVLRRYKRDVNREVMKYKNLTLDITLRELTVEDVNIALSPLEVRIMRCFMTYNNRALSREFLLDNAWTDGGNYHDNSVNVAIKRLRKKIEKHTKELKIKSIRNKGYKLC